MEVYENVEFHFFCRNSVNSVLTNACALSETITSGNPHEANDFLRASIVVADVDVRHRCISSHFE